MQLDVCTANKLSALCQRVTRAERLLNITSSFGHAEVQKKNQFNALSVLCQRIKRLEKAAGIKTVPKPPGYIAGTFGPSGNALAANKVNALCGRLARVEKLI